MEFRGKYYFLSNIYPCTIKYGSKQFTCVESAFQTFAVVASYEPYEESGKEFCGTSGIVAEYSFTDEEKKTLKKAVKARKRELVRGLRLAF